MLKRSNAFGDRATPWPSRSSSRLSESRTNGTKRKCIVAPWFDASGLLHPTDDEQVAEPSQVGIAVRLRVRGEDDCLSHVLDSDRVRRRESFPESAAACHQVHAKDLRCCRSRSAHALHGIFESPAMAPLKGDICRPQRVNWAGIPTRNREKRPGGAD